MGNASKMCSGYGLAELLKDKENPIGIEIGVDCGHTTEYLLESNPTLRLECVDPFETYVDWNGTNLNNRDFALEEWKRRSEKFGDRVVLRKMKSDDFVQYVKDDSLDFIFIDGLHTYEQVKKDMNNYYPKVKSGGIFAGHDYSVISDVNKAVNEFGNEKGLSTPHTTECDVWYWIKS